MTHSQSPCHPAEASSWVGWGQHGVCSKGGGVVARICVQTSVRTLEGIRQHPGKWLGPPGLAGGSCQAVQTARINQSFFWSAHQSDHNVILIICRDACRATYDIFELVRTHNISKYMSSFPPFLQ